MAWAGSHNRVDWFCVAIFDGLRCDTFWCGTDEKKAQEMRLKMDLRTRCSGDHNAGEVFCWIDEEQLDILDMTEKRVTVIRAHFANPRRLRWMS